MNPRSAFGDRQASWLVYFEASARERIADLSSRCALDVRNAGHGLQRQHSRAGCGDRGPARPETIGGSVERLFDEGRFANAARVLRDEIAAMRDVDMTAAALTANRPGFVSA